MFSYTEALNNRDSKPQHDVQEVSPSPQRDSTYAPEKTQDPVSPDSTISPKSASPPSPGLEPVRSDDETLKEAAATPYFDPPGKEFYGSAPPEDHPANRKKKRRILPWIVAAALLVVVLAIALGVGLGVGLKNKGSKKSMIPSSLSTVGAFNGSGIALASQSFDSGGFGSIVMYFQHHTGQIRSAQLDTNGDWKGGDATEVVAVDAKNGTPIAAVAYARNETAKWHIFYINRSGTISEVVNSNRTNVWAPGPISKLNLRPMDDPHVGLQACWYGSFYSDVEYKHSPVPGQSDKPGNDSDQTVGIHLWYGSDPTTFNSVAWIYGDTVWTEQQEFKDYNGHAGVGCYSWGPGSNTYVFFINLQNEVNILWKDLNISHPKTPEHPVHEWVKSNISIPAYTNSSLGYTNFLYLQNPDLTFSGFNISWAAEKTALPPASDHSQTFQITGEKDGMGSGVKGLPGSHLSVTALPDTSGGDSLLAFYQTNGSDVTEFVRDFNAGQWTSSRVPIPDA